MAAAVALTMLSYISQPVFAASGGKSPGEDWCGELSLIFIREMETGTTKSKREKANVLVQSLSLNPVKSVEHLM